MVDIELYDMLVFEDEAGSIYQDCVCSIDNNFPKVVQYTTNCCYVDIDKNTNEITIDDYSECQTFSQGNKLILKEVWHRTDKITYKKIWDANIKEAHFLNSTISNDELNKLIDECIE